MKKITWTWKKILTLAAGALGIGTLVSCYGMPIADYPDPAYDIYGIVKSNKNQPIKGIAVTYLDKTVYTDDKGFFSFGFNYNDNLPLSGELTFKDVDGEENGSFDDRTIYVPFGNDINVILNEKE